MRFWFITIRNYITLKQLYAKTPYLTGFITIRNYITLKLSAVSVFVE